jgi:large subunit ribosomal protein L23
MAKKKEKIKEEKKEARLNDKVGQVLKYDGILLKPRVTEKASLLQAQNVYAFEIADGSGKKEIAKAVKEAYKVTPIRINIVKNPAKSIFMKGKKGMVGGVKKAYVFLKQGDKIQTN